MLLLPLLLLYCSCSYAASGWMAYKTYSWEGWKAHLAWAAAFMCKYSLTYCPAAEQWWNTARTSTLGTSFGYDWCGCGMCSLEGHVLAAVLCHMYVFSDARCLNPCVSTMLLL